MKKTSMKRISDQSLIRMQTDILQQDEEHVQKTVAVLLSQLILEIRDLKDRLRTLDPD